MGSQELWIGAMLLCQQPWPVPKFSKVAALSDLTTVVSGAIPLWQIVRRWTRSWRRMSERTDGPRSNINSRPYRGCHVCHG